MPEFWSPRFFISNCLLGDVAIGLSATFCGTGLEQLKQFSVLSVRHNYLLFSGFVLEAAVWVYLLSVWEGKDKGRQEPGQPVGPSGCMWNCVCLWATRLCQLVLLTLGGSIWLQVSSRRKK
jgi:hypothetical protein